MNSTPALDARRESGLSSGLKVLSLKETPPDHSTGMTHASRLGRVVAETRTTLHH